MVQSWIFYKKKNKTNSTLQVCFNFCGKTMLCCDQHEITYELKMSSINSI